MTDTNKLKELAQRAIGFDMKNDWMFKPVISYLAAANPAAVLDLIAEVEALRGALQAVVDDPTWRSNDNTLWPKIIKAMDKGTKS
ncbi:hypothetical protein ACM7UX_16650 [Pseudomonas aeruginosa]